MDMVLAMRDGEEAVVAVDECCGAWCDERRGGEESVQSLVRSRWRTTGRCMVIDLETSALGEVSWGSEICREVRDQRERERSR
jgi:hypothetical protein